MKKCLVIIALALCVAGIVSGQADARFRLFRGRQSCSGCTGPAQTYQAPAATVQSCAGGICSVR